MQSRKQYKPINFEIGDHWGIAGITKAGKTYGVVKIVKDLFAIPEIMATMNLYFVDTKNVGDFADFPNHILSETCPPPLDGVTHNCMVWHPLDDENEEELEQFLKQIFEQGHAILVIDELTVFCYGKRANNFSKQLKKILKIGRGLFITAFLLTQELAGIPRQFWQCRHFLRFYIGPAYDVSLSNRKLGFTKEQIKRGVEPITRYGFWYKPLGEREAATFYRSVQHFLSVV